MNRIIQITVSYNHNDEEDYVYGLGEDNNVYMWDYQDGKWVLNSLGN